MYHSFCNLQFQTQKNGLNEQFTEKTTAPNEPWFSVSISTKKRLVGYSLACFCNIYPIGTDMKGCGEKSNQFTPNIVIRATQANDADAGDLGSRAREVDGRGRRTASENDVFLVSVGPLGGID